MNDQRWDALGEKIEPGWGPERERSARAEIDRRATRRRAVVRLGASGVALALVAGGFWGAYILLSVRVGRRFPGGSGLALAMAVGAVMLVPVGIADAAVPMFDPNVNR